MAEAAQSEASPNSRFYCHKCNVQIQPQLPDYTCPRCQSGFIEELSQESADRRGAEDLSDVWTDMVNRTARSFPNALIDHLLASIAQGASAAAFGNVGQPLMVNLHSNPGDYAWGRGGLDAVITHLLNQLDGSGPAPLGHDQIATIPQTKISQEQVDKNLQCSVCMEDFKLAEVTRRLVCGHHFHSPCIVPWLKIHATCPICRLQLSETPSPSGHGEALRPEGAGTSGQAPQTHPAYQEDDCD